MYELVASPFFFNSKMAFLVKMFIRFYHLKMTLNKNV